MGSMWKRRPLAETDKHLISDQEKKELSQRIRKDKVGYGGKKVLSVSLGIMVNMSEISLFIVVW